MNIVFARIISDESWLNHERYADFRRAYEYAMTQTHAIPALSKCSPEEIWHVFEALRSGLERR